MANDLIALAALLWALGALLALVGAPAGGRGAVSLGILAFLAGALVALPGGTAPAALPFGLPGARWHFALAPEALWLLGFGLLPALATAIAGTPGPKRRQWAFGLAMSLLGALGVAGIQDAAGFLIAWEVMSLGGAVMLLGEALDRSHGKASLQMLGLLEVGAVALLLVMLLLSERAGGTGFDGFAGLAAGGAIGWLVVVLMLIGIGAKIGLLPFYEWFPQAYGSGSGATGIVMSGVVLNAAFYALLRALTLWVPAAPGTGFSLPGLLVLALGVASAILAALHAFQQEDWRRLLSLSSAENAGIAVAMLGAAMIFRQDGEAALAGLALAVALVLLAAHALAKGALFTVADGVYRACGSYRIAQSGLLRRQPFLFGLGAVLAVMSLAALPPTAGFLGEWYVFQVMFQGFRLHTLAGHIAMTLGGAGLALTAAIALATFVKLAGIGLLGRADDTPDTPLPGTLAPARQPLRALLAGALGLGTVALAVGLPWWIGDLGPAIGHMGGATATANMHDGWLMVPLSAGFAFTSPTKLVIVMPLLAILPLLMGLARRRSRRAPVWFGGAPAHRLRAATTALTFSNALRTFYGFVYHPAEKIDREAAGPAPRHRYFTRRLDYRHEITPFFQPWLFAPVTAVALWLSRRVRRLQSGHLNAYLGILGALLVLILALQLIAV